MKTTFVKGYTRTVGGKPRDPFQSEIDARRHMILERRESRVWIPESEIRDQHRGIAGLMRKLGFKF